jgi:hypothetical protein
LSTKLIKKANPRKFRQINSGQTHENIHIISGNQKFAKRFQKSTKQTQKPNPTCSFAIIDKYQKNNPVFIEKIKIPSPLMRKKII